MAQTGSAARFIDSPIPLMTRGLNDGAPSLHNVVTHAIHKARSQGLDDIQQYNCAVRAVMRVEPDLPLLVAARVINGLLETLDGHDHMPRHPGVVVRRTSPTTPEG